MGRGFKLTQLHVDRTKAAGLYGDGAGLWLKVNAGGSRSWIYRYMLSGKQRWAGLGSYPDVTLAAARERAAEMRKMLASGRDPLDEKKSTRSALVAASAKTITFDSAAKLYIDSHKEGWRNAKHIEQWRSTLQTYASAKIGALDVSKIETAHILSIFQKDQLWTEKTETASRLRGRIESILDWCTVHKYRSGENPARWKGHLDKLLPAKNRVMQREHFPALPYAEISSFMSDLRSEIGVAARAVEFVILTACRSGEARGCTWSEIDLDNRLWIIPAARMKAGKEHRVPLSSQALDLILDMQKLKTSCYVFRGMKDDSMLSDMSLTAVLRRMNRKDITVHGFRSTFRDWGAEKTDFSTEMLELALAHTISNQVEAAYRRGDMFEKRRKMMQTWADYCFSKTI